MECSLDPQEYFLTLMTRHQQLGTDLKMDFKTTALKLHVVKAKKEYVTEYNPSLSIQVQTINYPKWENYKLVVNQLKYRRNQQTTEKIITSESTQQRTENVGATAGTSGITTAEIHPESGTPAAIQQTNIQQQNQVQQVPQDGLHAGIVNLISTYGGFDVPTKTNVRQSILDIAKITMTVIPCVPILKIQVGIDCYHLLWNGITEPVIINLMDQYKLTQLKVINLIDYTTSDDPLLLRRKG
ncbi:unnamed protein product [Mytilus coruscus]|uniref:Uncharacterized protein n=1 Tax=Mytilus coruscus TaxID=42192 RepID=A0A6J8A9E6_MYTCO|nr:unnamed protein product [Mytilus coruscus]